MKTNSTKINFPWKYLKDTYIGETFYLDHPAIGTVWMKTFGSVSRKMYLLDLSTNEIIEIPDGWDDKHVYLVDAIVHLEMIKREEKKQE